MPVQRDNPYGSFNFQVVGGPLQGGFQEVTGLDLEVTTAEYRNGNDKVNHVRKIDSIYKVGDVTLKRGLMGAEDLYKWINQVRLGDPGSRQTVTIQLLDETGNTPVMTWVLTEARPKKYTGPSLNAKTGTDVAIEELVLTCEDLRFG